jgi:nitroreductase
MMAGVEDTPGGAAQSGGFAADGRESASGNAGTSAIGMLLTRHSVGPKHLSSPGPTTGELRAAFAAALRAPDHGKLVPFRFVVIRDDGLARLAELFVDYGRRCGKSDEELVRERERAAQAPVVIAIVARIDSSADVPPHEQWIAVGGAVANVLNALHFMGFGAKTLSGLRASDPAIVGAFCGEDEQLVGWISVGTPMTRSAPRGKDPVDEVYSEF